MPRLSVIIVSWNTRGLLVDCLKSLAAEVSLDETEVWVVDNASTDGSAQSVEQEFSWVHLIALDRNLGFGGANNLAYPCTSGDRVLLLNPDTLVPPGSLTRLVEYLESHPEVGAVGPRILSPDGSLQLSIHPTPTLFREAWRLFFLDRFLKVSQYSMKVYTGPVPRQVDVIMGSCMLIRRKVIEQVGLFDEQFFIYSEEVDLCERIRRGGWPIHFVPDASITHFGGQSTGQIADAMFIELYRNKVKFSRKYYGETKTNAYKLLLWLVALTRIFFSNLALVLPGQKKQRYQKIGAQYRQLLSVLGGL